MILLYLTNNNNKHRGFGMPFLLSTSRQIGTPCHSLQHEWRTHQSTQRYSWCDTSGMASQTALSPQLEKQYILPGTQMKPADLFIPTWSAGKPLAIDISVVSPTQSHLLLYNHTQTEKLCAAHWREEQKNTKYLEALHSQNILFIPMAVETFGWRADQFLPLLRTEFRVALDGQNHVSSISCTKDWPSHCRGNMPVQWLLGSLLFSSVV